MVLRPARPGRGRRPSRRGGGAGRDRHAAGGRVEWGARPAHGEDAGDLAGDGLDGGAVALGDGARDLDHPAPGDHLDVERARPGVVHEREADGRREAEVVEALGDLGAGRGRREQEQGEGGVAHGGRGVFPYGGGVAQPTAPPALGGGAVTRPVTPARYLARQPPPHTMSTAPRDASAPPPGQEEDLEKALRPRALDDFIGQKKIKDNLRVFITAALQRGEALDHVILSGPPGLGKTTLAHIIAEEMGAEVKTTSGPALDKPASIAGLLTNLNEGDVLFIDEIHRLAPVVEEYLYSAMEDYAIDILIDSGPSARSVRIALPPFTLIGATTRKGLLTAPLRARFGVDFRYDYYDVETLHRIVLRSAGLMNVEIDDDGAHEIARRSRGTPRIANKLLRRTRDFAEVETAAGPGDGRITRAVAGYALNALEVDEAGLDDMDARILLTLMEKHDGGPVGVSNIAVTVGEDSGTIEEVYEPYLIQEGFIARTPRGRVATRRAYDHFDIVPPLKQSDIFDELLG